MTASARKPGCPPDDSRPAAAPLPLAKCGAFSSEKVASSSTYTARQSMSRADHGELSVVVAGANNPNLNVTMRLVELPLQTTAPAVLQGLTERMMGLEPTTFCMASRRSSQLSYIRVGRQYSVAFQVTDCYLAASSASFTSWSASLLCSRRTAV